MNFQLNEVNQIRESEIINEVKNQKEKEINELLAQMQNKYHFTIKTKIGHGGFGEVSKIQRNVDFSKVLKIYYISKKEKSTERINKEKSRLNHEALLTVNLKSRYIIKSMFNISAENSNGLLIGIIMEYATKSNLTRIPDLIKKIKLLLFYWRKKHIKLII